jgi:ribosomal protein S18 acetylase RimI-like enzyme
VHDVVVAPAFRGRGIGRAVMTLLLDHPAVRGALAVRLETRDADTFYRKLGFVDGGGEYRVMVRRAA